ncbi:MAG: DNA polymerase III subunit delta [Flavobacteriales bacterium]|jgi:DNA polymerase-3 subunit delta|nr:DNA polymerase III subunit delta [Flavobacteriales bacterium]MBK9512070.1 DNA polymerase III subunit delta [Flavobacteriales bacterium]MBP7448496.1 DNA polymerase III subunit delta [Flavobacteriales bacterium]HOZ39916.1 DNA polymerase III subunit delta [Flavobacteriales bacterium]
MSVLDDYKKLMLEVRAGAFRPVYLLHGEESFFIDRVADEIEHLALADHERDFNQTILYGRDANPDVVKDTCLRYPMMADRQVVIVRELQNWRIDEVEKLEPYLNKPTPTTVLVLCYKHKKVDGRKGVIKAVQKGGGAVLSSDKVKEDKLPELLMGVAKSQKRRLAQLEAQLLATHLGSDLAKAVKEVEKLCLVTEEGGAISSDHIQRFVGISKEYNVFELQNAIGMRNAAKAQQIAAHFAADPKDNPLPVTLGFLNTYFSKLAMVHTLNGRPPQEMASALKVNPFFVKDYVAQARNYSLGKLVEIQRHLRQCDLRSKGLGGDGGDHGELLRELLAKVMT